MKAAMPSRRQFFRRAAQLAAAGTGAPLAVFASQPSQPATRSLALDHTHTGERIELVYAAAGEYIPQALTKLNRFLRDHYSGEVGNIDPQLFDLLHSLQSQLRWQQPYQVISGYRCPKTNELLRTTRAGGVASRSLHMDGKAIDIRLPGVPLAEVRDAALSLQAGGVGYYSHEQFVHVDTGRVRRW
jgi:uncharacterized protein YcbK (DUF882 family)